LGAESVDLAYKALGDIALPYSRAVGTTPSTCFAPCALNTGVVANFISFHFTNMSNMKINEIYPLQRVC
jgi:hypothetical protein